jgi:nicotinamidase/pyrazinamidase
MKALIIVDVQNDFLPGGALAVPQGDEVIEPINRLAAAFPILVVTQDWHPENHASFAANHPDKQPGDIVVLDEIEQRLWPVHCVQDTPGAELHPDLQYQRQAHVVRKGTDPQVDSYSGFFDNQRRRATGLSDLLRQQGVSKVYIVGLATDYCVKFTALDAVQLGFKTYVIPEACRGVNLQPDDSEKALQEMQDAGVELLTIDEAIRHATS